MLSKPTSIIFRRCYATRSFKDLNVSQSICNNLQRHFGIEEPTLAQSRFIPVIQSGHDLLLRDRTGTGKTFGIAVALASKLVHESQNERKLRSLYIVPNQELAVQIERWMHLLMDGTSLNAAAAYHAQSIVNDKHTSLPSHTLIGTPAHLLDSINTIPIHNIDCIVIEEADQALRLPTRYAPLKKQKKRASNPKPTETLVNHLLQLNTNTRTKNKKKPQLIAASATLNRPLRHWMRMQGWTYNPVFVDITKNVEAVSKQTQHYCLFVSRGEIRNIGSLYNIDEQMEKENPVQQQQQLVDSSDYEYNNQVSLIESVAVLNEIEQVHNGVLFVDTSVSTSDVARQLAEYGVRARDIRDYDQRNSNEEEDGATPLWIATEFSARGMDIGNVSHVFILGEPKSVGGYVHMAGRTGRLGPGGIRGGKVITLVEDKGKAETRMSNIYKMLNAQVEHYEHVQ
ncbi:P-loop containing nucleoside triphosphate hydrolase protein [Phascolomyces articulosus]|uniref:RNA helicase n=1 Tax=Phascolomyces articulosus TaxID=60185 RepID=A0AAD5JLN8_9FUNG|nr:P-loop containing nucleoside triphosphate hydrolase protein [Phascolomyces articulosus]